MIGVVIPYFQRTPGLLHRALRSVAAQCGAPPFRVYVVDDGSPAPPASELDDLPDDFAGKVIVLRRSNRGPGTARNAALDAMPPDIDVVAFLDSDDVWTEDHLMRAATALAAGGDFYFADHQRDGDAETRFAQCGYGAAGRAIGGPGADMRWCDPKAVFQAIALRSPVGTSTVVIRRRSIGSVRFPRQFRCAGEDTIFWAEVLRRGARPVCSLQREAAYGSGVSIFNHRSWGDARSLRTTLDEMRAQHHLRRRFPLDEALDVHARAQCARLDLSFCANLIACARRLQWDAMLPALRYVGRRPWALLRMPAALAKALRQRRTPAAA
jgi:succinoglycan biosynthesis protein ExoW